MTDRRASISGGRSAQSEGWELIHNWKYRKKKKKTKTKLKKTIEPTTIYQQLDLRGENIDETDGEAFGDLCGKKAIETVRITSQNINGIPEQRTHYRSREITSVISQGTSDAWLIQEPGLCWPKVDETNQWSERTKKKGTRWNSNFGFNRTELERSEAKQAGGSAIITTNELTPRCTSRGSDPTGLGRWVWTRLEGSDGFHTRLVSAYRPCIPSSQGAGTVWEQHRRFFGEIDRDPRQALLDDLKVEIVAWQLTGDVIVLGMDANEDVRSRKLKTYFDDLQMKNVILDRHKYLSPPATHTRNTKREPIDGIWVSKSLDPIAAGFLAVGSAFSSDHVAL
jgi:hypothetical protein